MQKMGNCFSVCKSNGRRGWPGSILRSHVRIEFENQSGWQCVEDKAMAFYLNQKGETAKAIATRKAIVEKHPEYQDAQMLLREIASTAQKP